MRSGHPGYLLVASLGRKREVLALLDTTLGCDYAHFPTFTQRTSMPVYQRTFSATPTDIVRDWHVVDVSGLILGRAASQIASVLKGKHRPKYTPSMDMGDFVVVVNAEKIKVTGNKAAAKLYYRHPRAGFPGGLKTETFESLARKHPEDIVYRAVQRMLPRSSLGRQMLTKLHVYPGAVHPHHAQKPKQLTLKHRATAAS